ncbi:conserved hypothetical protein, partial [Ricinus communis]
AIVVRRQAEVLAADGDHVRIQLDGRHARLRETLVAELRQRGAAEAQLHDAARLRQEQHPHHHHLDVFELDRIGPRQPHRALHPRGAEVQRAHAFEFGDRGRRVAGPGEAGIPGVRHYGNDHAYWTGCQAATVWPFFSVGLKRHSRSAASAAWSRIA